MGSVDNCFFIHAVLPRHVETVVELSQKHIDHSIRVELDLDEFDETPSELRKKATYKEIRNYVLRSTESRLQHLPYLK